MLTIVVIVLMELEHLPEKFPNLFLLVLLCAGDDPLLEEEPVVLVELKVGGRLLPRSRQLKLKINNKT